MSGRSDHVALYERMAKWLESNTKDQRNRPDIEAGTHGRCMAVMTQASYNGAIYNVNTTANGFHVGAKSVVASIRNTLATYDTNALTRMVIAAHVHCCRLEVAPRSMSSIEITIHARSATGDRLFERHPGIEALRPDIAAATPTPEEVTP